MTSEPATLPVPQRDIIGTDVSVTSYDEVLELMTRPPRDRALTIAVCNVHSVVSARRDARLRSALTRADLTTPDGMPLVWALRLLGHESQQRVYGPTLMERAFRHGVAQGWRHYLYGGTPDRLALLQDRLNMWAPGSRVVGAHAPPFRPLHDEEEDCVVEHIAASGANVVWLGIGCPKQEIAMQRFGSRLPGTALVGVGAAFDYLSGVVQRPPVWMQDLGMEWLFRLTREPRRLWRRYLSTNPAFVALFARQLLVSQVRGLWHG